MICENSGDGIAVRSSDFVNGMPDTSSWKPGVDYVRADTGDDFDDAFDAVIMIESVSIHEDGSVSIDPEAATEVTAGLEVVSCGSNVMKDEPVISAGTKITPLDVAALALSGITSLKVKRKPRVGFIPTGSELIPAGTVPSRGQNIDTNSLLVKNMIDDCGGVATCYPIVIDDEGMLENAMEKALAENDIVIINGGSSRGEQDYNTKLLKKKGKFLFHRCAAGPGMPMAASVSGEKLMINLPGPTLGAFYCMEWFVRPVIAGMLETSASRGTRVAAVLAEDVMTPEIMEFQYMVRLERSVNGSYVAHPLTFENSRGIARMTADGAFVSPIGTGLIKADTKIEVELFRS